MFKAWPRNTRKPRPAPAAPTWCSTTGSAACATVSCSFCSRTIGAPFSASLRCRVRQHGLWLRASGAIRTSLTTFYVCANFRTGDARVLARSDAALFVARELGWPWRALTAARVVPKVLRDALYDIVARTRYRVFGRYEQCLAPRPEFRSRFVE